MTREQALNADVTKLLHGTDAVEVFKMSAQMWRDMSQAEKCPTFSRGDCREWADRFEAAAALAAPDAGYRAGIEDAAGVLDRAAALLAADERERATWGGPDPRGEVQVEIGREFVRLLRRYAAAIRALTPPAPWAPPPEGE